MTRISKLIPALAIVLAMPLFNNSAHADHDTFYDRYLENGNFVMYAPQPTTQEEFWVVSEMFTLDEDHVQEIRERNNYNPNVGDYFSLSNCNDDWTHCTFEYMVFDNSTYSFLERHSEDFDIEYVYDPAIKAKVEEFLNGITLSSEGYEAKDMELLNYWIAQMTYSNSEDPDTKAPMLPNFSSELKTAFSNTNLDFEVDVRCGFQGSLASGQCGIGKVYFNGTYYQSVSGNVEVKANHVFYVPSDTVDEDLTAALEERIYSIFGEDARNVISVDFDSELPTVDSILADYEMDAYDFIEDVSTEKLYFIQISDGQMGNSFPIVIKKDSSKLFVPSGINSTDLVTGINISSDVNNLPGDVKARVSILGESMEEYTETLNVEESYTYDLGLHSDSTSYNVTEEDGHTFVVSAPIPANLKNMPLSAYFIGENGEIEEYEANTDDGETAVFEVSHFSIYTLAKSSNAAKTPNTGSFTGLKSGANIAQASSVVIVISGILFFIYRKSRSKRI